jgi:predicted dithiol-disulfide oxidoreductase (DUF899 family)
VLVTAAQHGVDSAEQKERVDMTTHTVGTREQHLQARLELLEAEKELTRRSDELAAQRRSLPWVPVDTTYRFDTNEGEKTLPELFDGRSQLLVYHFMFGPDWTEGCPVCSFWADSFNGGVAHLNQRDITFTCVSRAPLDRIDGYKRRMGWSFPWVSSLSSDFNCDFGVSFPDAPTGTSQADMPRGPGVVQEGARYNFTQHPFGGENPGLSAFALDEGVIYHTYSCYARGLDIINSAYQLLDRAPDGRNEDNLPVPIVWVRRHDEYEPHAAEPR